MKIKSHILFRVLCACIILSGCAQWTITGQNSVWKVGTPSETKSQTTDTGYKLVGIYSNTADMPRINKEPDAIAIYLKTLYLKYIQDIYNFDVIVYAEVYDKVDEKKVLKRIAFHRVNQPPDSYLNFTDALLYGPIHFAGYPITVKLYVLELDKRDNELFSEFLRVVSSVAVTAQPQYGPAIQTAASIMGVIISLNPDDLEFSHEITFSPVSDVEKPHYDGKASLVVPLQYGDFIIVKKEDEDRIVFNRWWRFAKRSEEDAKRVFNPEEVLYDANMGKLKYNKDEKEGKDYEDKTYAVLAISKSTQAADRALLEEINDAVQQSLDELRIKRESLEKDQVAAIKSMGNYAEATVRLFHIKNLISGKTRDEKVAVLEGSLTDETKATESDKIVNKEIKRLLYKITGDVKYIRQ